MDYLKNELFELIKEDTSIYDLIQESSLDGLCFWDLENPENKWMNPKLWATLGYNAQKNTNLVSAWQDIIHQDDLKLAIDNVAKLSKDPSYPYDQVVRYLHKEGHTVSIRWEGTVIWNNVGKPVRMLGIHTYISKSKDAEVGLQKLVRRYQHIIEGADIGTWEWNAQTDETIFNEKWANTIGYTLSELGPLSVETWLKFVHPDDLAKSAQVLEDHLADKIPFYECESRMKHKEGYWIWVLNKGKVVSWTADGKPEWMTGSQLDISKQKKVEEDLRFNKQKLKLVYNSTSDPLFLLDVEDNNRYKFVSINNSFLQTTGLAEESVLNQYIDDIILPPNLHFVKQKYAEAIQSKKMVTWEEESVYPAGTKIGIVSIIPVFDNKGICNQLVGSVKDISQRKKAEEELIKEKNRFQNLVENIPGVYWINDLESQSIVYISPSYEKMWGRTRKDLYKDSTNFINTIHPDDRIALFEAQKKGANISGTDISFRILTPDGEIRWIEAHLKTVTDSGGKKLEYGYAEDITELKNTHLSMAESVNRLSTMVQIEPECIMQLNSDNKLLYMNPAGLSMIEAENLEMIMGLSVLGIVRPRYHRAFSKIVKGVFKGNPGKLEFEIVGLKGNHHWLETHAVPMRDTKGKIISLLAVTRDVTERKKAEEGLLASIKETSDYKCALDHAALVSIMDQKGTIIHANDIFCKVSKYNREELLGQSYQIIDSGSHSNEFFEDMIEIISSGNVWRGEIKNKAKDGTYYWTDTTITPFLNKMGEPYQYLTIWYDITLQKNTQQKLQVALAKLEGLLDASTQVSIIGMDTNGLITTFNKGSENLLGYKRDEMRLQKYSEIIHVKEEVEEREEELSIQLNKKVQGFKVFVALANIGKYETREWTYVRKDGTRFPVQLTITAIKDKSSIVGYLGVAANISEIKKVEREVKLLLDVTNGQNDRLRNFAHIVSHNLRSHSGNFSMLLDLLVKEEPGISDNELIAMLISSSDNLKETIANLNEVVLINTSVNDNLVNLNLSNAIEAAILSTTALAKTATVSIHNEVNPDINILGISAYLDSILLNFITNGIKYRCPERESFIRLRASIKQKYIVLFIEDNGLGINLKVNKSKLFGMYKTFHKNKDARGIGLFITKNQVEAIGGKIEVESEVNVGTTFKIYLKYEKN